MTDQNKHRMANYMALKTAVINGEEALVEKLLDNQPMLDIEKKATFWIWLIWAVIAESFSCLRTFQ